jgi:hypothetical protein
MCRVVAGMAVVSFPYIYGIFRVIKSGNLASGQTNRKDFTVVGGPLSPNQNWSMKALSPSESLERRLAYIPPSKTRSKDSAASAPTSIY